PGRARARPDGRAGCRPPPPRRGPRPRAGWGRRTRGFRRRPGASGSDGGDRAVRRAGRSAPRADRPGPPLARLPAQLLQALDRPVALERGQVVDEELAVEVVDLVLDAGRQQAVDPQLERLAVAVERLDHDAVG